MGQYDREAEILAELPDDLRAHAVSINRETFQMFDPKYVLNKDNVPCPVGLGTWSAWFEAEGRKPHGGRRRVAETTLEHPGIGPVWISTVFIGIDHSVGVGPRHLFETMICWRHGTENRTWDREWRYPTWATAEAGHTKAVTLAQAYLDGAITIEEFDQQ